MSLKKIDVSLRWQKFDFVAIGVTMYGFNNVELGSRGLSKRAQRLNRIFLYVYSLVIISLLVPPFFGLPESAEGQLWWIGGGLLLISALTLWGYFSVFRGWAERIIAEIEGGSVNSGDDR